jgi:hypothetical protein
VRFPTAAKTLEVDRILHPPDYVLLDCVARLMSGLIYPKGLAAVLQHFGHEGQTFERKVLIKSCSYLFEGSNFDPLSGPKIK